MFPTAKKSILISQQLERSQPNLTIFTPFKTVAEFFPAVINNKTKNIFPKELYCDLVDLNKKTNYKVILKESAHKDINSLLMKKLELWDKEHLENREENTELLYKKLYIRYKNKNLENELKKLEILNDMIKSKKNFNKIMDSNEGTNKILDEFFEKKNKEQGSILKNNIAKTKSRFNFSLFLTKTLKDIEQDFGVDSKTINAMNSQELDSDFYTKVIKNNLKYETQLYNELMTVNNDIYDKKSEKKDLAKKINEIYLEESRLTTQYQDLIKEQKKGLDKFQDEYYEKNKRKNKSNKLSSMNKVKKMTSKANKAIKLGINLYKKISEKNDFYKNASTIQRKHQMDLEIKIFKENYFSKMRELNIEKV